MILISINGRRHAIERREFKSLPAGGYICRIAACKFGKNGDGHDVLILNVDISEGEFAGYFQNFADRFSYWNYGAVFRRKVFGANGEDFADSFQQLLEDIEDSNAGFKFDDAQIDNDEHSHCKEKAAVLKSELFRNPKPRTAFLYSTPKGGLFSYG